MLKDHPVYIKTSWLTERSDTHDSSLFDMPKGVQFLLSIDKEGRDFYPLNLKNRVSAYFWWRKVVEKNAINYSIEWVLGKQEEDFLSEITLAGWRNEFKNALHQYLQLKSCFIPLIDENINDLFPGRELKLAERLPEIVVPGAIDFLLSCRIDLRNNFDLATFPGYCAIIEWWQHDGENLYAKLKFNISAMMSNLLRYNYEGNDWSLPLFVFLLLKERDDLKKAFDVSTLSGVDGFILWWEQHGKNEYPQIPWDPKLTIDALQRLADTKSDINLPVWFVALQQQLPELQCFDSTKTIDVLSLLSWWQKEGSSRFSRFSLKLDLEQMGFFACREHGDTTLPLFLSAIIDSRKELVKICGDSVKANLQLLVEWWNLHGQFEFLPLLGTWLKLSDNGCITIVCGLLNKAPGINIIGFPQGTLGLGEDARLAGQVVESLGLDGAYINAPIPGPEKTVIPDDRLPFVDVPKFSVSLFCLPPTEMIRLVIENGKHLINGDEYKIGAWPWELPHWPTAFSHVRGFVDEIWAQSDFVRDSFLKEGQTPVYKMPMAVTVPHPTENVRHQYGIANNAFIYYLMFDGNSWLSRKNPVAGVLAFQQAFADKNKYLHVSLLIKAMNITRSDPMWQRVEEIARHDSRIIIITERLGRQNLINLMSSCNCYISLHRSEGFGRIIAEAMLLGQPVVTTNFSGNVDFCHADTAFLVDGELVPLRQGDYIFFEGQYWCDPDIDQAAIQMLRVYEDNEQRGNIARSGKEFIKKNYSVEAVAEFYSERFKEIKKINGHVE